MCNTSTYRYHLPPGALGIVVEHPGGIGRSHWVRGMLLGSSGSSEPAGESSSSTYDPFEELPAIDMESHCSILIIIGLMPTGIGIEPCHRTGDGSGVCAQIFFEHNSLGAY